MIKIALVDDHVVVRSGFAQLLTLEPDISVVGQYASAQEALPKLLNLEIDVAIMDISMPDENGLQLLSRLRQKSQTSKPLFSVFTIPLLLCKAP